MSRRARRKGRFGRYLATVSAEPFLAMIPRGIGEVVAGFSLATRTTRPYLKRDGSVTIRLVFRGKEDGSRGDTMVLTWTLCGPLTEAAMSALALAMGPRLRLDDGCA